MKTRNSAFNRVFTALVFIFLYAPILLLIVFSFNEGNSSVVWQGFSLHWYEELFHNRLIMQSLYTTLLVSVLATAIAQAPVILDQPEAINKSYPALWQDMETIKEL